MASRIEGKHEDYNGTDIAVPDNVVTPSLLKELKKAGVPIKESGKVSDVKFSARDFGLEDLNKESANNIKMRGGVIVSTETELDSHISSALNGSGKLNLYIGAISEDSKAKIEKDVGISIFKKPGQYTCATRTAPKRSRQSWFLSAGCFGMRCAG